jgi:hypothetical protein
VRQHAERDLDPVAALVLRNRRGTTSRGERDEVEFKANLRTNLHKLHLAVLKTIARFLNAKGVPS